MVPVFAYIWLYLAYFWQVNGWVKYTHPMSNINPRCFFPHVCVIGGGDIKPQNWFPCWGDSLPGLKWYFFSSCLLLFHPFIRFFSQTLCPSWNIQDSTLLVSTGLHKETGKTSAFTRRLCSMAPAERAYMKAHDIVCRSRGLIGNWHWNAPEHVSHLPVLTLRRVREKLFWMMYHGGIEDPYAGAGLCYISIHIISSLAAETRRIRSSDMEWHLPQSLPPKLYMGASKNNGYPKMDGL